VPGSVEEEAESTWKPTFSPFPVDFATTDGIIEGKAVVGMLGR